jgi:hypothetical protein
MREDTVAPIHTSGVAMRHVGPRDATGVPLGEVPVPTFRSLNSSTTRLGSFPSLMYTLTFGSSTTIRAWNQASPSGAGTTGFSPPRLVVAEDLPAVLRVGDVLNGVGLLLRSLGPEVERPKVDRVVGLRVHEPEGDAQEVAPAGPTLPEGIELDHPVGELAPVEGDDRVVLLRLNPESGSPFGVLDPLQGRLGRDRPPFPSAKAFKSSVTAFS